jgi:hypothetical protein
VQDVDGPTRLHTGTFYPQGQQRKMTVTFVDRHEAGRRLAEALQREDREGGATPATSLLLLEQVVNVPRA